MAAFTLAHKSILREFRRLQSFEDSVLPNTQFTNDAFGVSVLGDATDTSADQAARPATVCENCMSTQQFSKFAA